MNIDRYNYEEYFILYLDNELDAESRLEVEAFAEQNPDLKAELDLLTQSKLAPDTNISFSDKGTLMRFHDSSVSLANYDEWLTAYIDNELTEAEKEDAERFIAGNPSIQRELNLLQRTKLQPETVVFPNKESLYRKEEKAKTITVRWWRMAAAAVLLLGISVTGLVLMNKNNDEGGRSRPTAANAPGKQTNPVNNTGSALNNNPKASISNPKMAGAKNDVNSQSATESPSRTNNISIARVRNQSSESKEKIGQTTPVQKGLVVVDPLPKVEIPKINSGNINNLPKPLNEDKNLIAGIDASPRGSSDKGPEKMRDAAVTPGPADPSDIKTGNSVQFANEKSGGGLRGFLRKVTRTFEKRTNIKATDDDDRLLIAGLAIKMN
jgi:hypothetical protein